MNQIKSLLIYVFWNRLPWKALSFVCLFFFFFGHQKHLSWCWVILWLNAVGESACREEGWIGWLVGTLIDLGFCDFCPRGFELLCEFLFPDHWNYVFWAPQPPRWFHFKRSRQLPAVSCPNAILTLTPQGCTYQGLILIVNMIVFIQANKSTRNRNMHFTGGPTWRLIVFLGWKVKYLKFNEWIASWMWNLRLNLVLWHVHQPNFFFTVVVS